MEMSAGVAPLARLERTTFRLGAKKLYVVHSTLCKPVSLQSIGFTGFFGDRISFMLTGVILFYYFSLRFD